MNDPRAYESIELCLLAGKVMLQSGAETYRVEDTMSRMAAALGLPNSHSYVTPTGIIFSVDGAEPAKLIRIKERTTDLQKVTSVNSISRSLVSGQISPSEARQQLQEIELAKHAFPVWLHIVAAAVASGSFLIMFGGGWNDALPAFVCGGLGFSSFLFSHRLVEVKFFSELSAAFLIGMLAFLFHSLQLGAEVDKIIIASVMPLVPGLLITNAVRDLMAGHLVSGLSRGADAFLTAFAIGTGIALVFTLF
ncbi:threonine/serine exporter family protein [Paenibacillus sp. GCM10023252]|uniref:threonine/serine exporter family protein n=1 Tax=Paenibacillus sp. GCM10023252 TaxID=3252649 RepID=UPI00361597AE